MEPALTDGVLVGEVLGRYRVVEPLGEGSMATVYAGEHVVLGHQVAIKIMHPEYMRESQMERRLLREARALAAIRHPGIVQLVDIGRGPGGRPYIIMELLQGETLAYRLLAGALPEQQTLLFARQIASALAAAHEHDIVHRDLKPENVFIVNDPAVPLGERAKIIDFGIAKRTPVDVTPSPRITKIGVVVGTPEYMSPEQCAGDDVDARSDVYSLGVVMYQMATGELPFAGSTGELIAHHRYVGPPRPRTIATDMSAPLDDLISRCLAKEARARYEDMHQVVDALDRLDSSILRDPDTDLYRIADGDSDSEADPDSDETEPRGLDYALAPTTRERDRDRFVEQTFDIPRQPPRIRRGRTAPVLALVAAACVLVAGAVLLLLNRGGSDADPEAASPAPAPVQERAVAEPEAPPPPDHAHAVAAKRPEPKPEPKTAPEPKPAPEPKVASLSKDKDDDDADRPRKARKAERRRRRQRPEPEPKKPARVEKPKETFTDVVTPTVF